MKTKRGFIYWYYTDGLSAFLRAIPHVFLFLPRYFSLRLLVRTLFSPWHRDVSLKGWNGFNPLQLAQLFVWNFLSRIIGAFVRLLVILFSLSVIIIFGVVIIALLVLYFGAPGFFVSSFILLASGYYIFGGLLLAVVFVIVLWARLSYGNFYHVPYAKMDLLMLARQAWFSRVWQRAGITEADVPQGVFSDVKVFEDFLCTHDLTLPEFERIIEWEMEMQVGRESRSKPFTLSNLHKIRPIGLYWHYGYTIFLNKFSTDITRYDHSRYNASPFFGQEREMEMLELVLHRPENNNALILGVPGVGRRALVHEFARRVRGGLYDGSALMYARVLVADIGAAVAQAQEEGLDPDRTVERLFHEAAYAGNVILLLENFERYMSESRGFSYASVIERYAGLPSFRIVGITSENEFHQKVEGNDAMLAHFDLIHLTEIDEVTAMKVLFSHFYTEREGIFTYQAFREVLDASQRYTNTAPLPARALSLATEVEIYWQKNSSDVFLRPADIQQFVTQKTGIPIGAVSQDEKEHLLSLESHIHKNIVGQEDAVNAVAEAIRRMRSGMARPNRPAGSFLFMGPTGVGKTEMAKTLAAEYFGDEQKISRLDMSEFQGEHALDALIGSRALRQKGRLSAMIEEDPYGILLLDEIEKANPRVLDVFLQILDEGFLHDGYGRKLSFRTMIIIATSNVGSDLIPAMISRNENQSVMRTTLIETAVSRNVFRVEFINRFDDVVVFHPIGGDQIVQITHLLLAKFSARTREDQNITVDFAPDVAAVVAQRGFQEKFGARSLLRYIDESVADALARKLIEGTVHRGDTIEFTIEDLV